MIDEKYYEGYEGEGAYTFYFLNKDGVKEGLSCWEGYFVSLLSGCFYPSYSSGGIVQYYNNCLESIIEPWKIKDLMLAITELRNYNKDNAEIYSESMYDENEELRQQLLSLLEKAQSEGFDVYIEYD